MFTGPEIAQTLVESGITHVVWLPDSTLGPWETAFAQDPKLSFVRVCREGEAWTVAAGLHLGGQRPLVIIQNTGLFESGDALRNVLFDLGLPLYALIGYRSYLLANSADTAKKYTEPVLKAWGLDYVLLDTPATAAEKFREHYRQCHAAGKPGVALLAEGRG